MKRLFRFLFPLRGEVFAANGNLFNWKLQITFLGQLVVLGSHIGRHNTIDLQFDHPLGVSVQEVLKIEDGDSIPTNLGNINREGNTLKFHIHRFWFNINRPELEKFASR